VAIEPEASNTIIASALQALVPSSAPMAFWQPKAMTAINANRPRRERCPGLVDGTIVIPVSARKVGHRMALQPAREAATITSAR
jgi:hypothetical protein